MREGLQASHVQPHWRLAHDVIWCRCADPTVAMSIGAGRYLTLSGLAHHLWPHLVVGADGASLCGAIQAKRGHQPSQTPERDVAALLSELVPPVPLMAHAWVEHGGAPANDTAEHLRLYVPAAH